MWYGEQVGELTVFLCGSFPGYEAVVGIPWDIPGTLLNYSRRLLIVSLFGKEAAVS